MIFLIKEINFFKSDVIIEVVDGVKNYFNSAIATKLLINNCERVQNLEVFYSIQTNISY